MWALTLILAIVGAAVMFGVGYAVGGGGHDDGGDRGDRASGQFAPGNLPDIRGFGQGQGQGQGQGGLGQGQGQGRGGLGQNGQLPGGNGGGIQQLPIPGGPGAGSGSGSGSGQTPSAPSTSGAFLGVATQQDTSGVKITQIASGSAADKAGLQVGDVITSFNGRTVTTPTALGTAVANLQPGDRVTLEVDRNGTTDSLTVTLGSRSTTNSN